MEIFLLIVLGLLFESKNPEKKISQEIEETKINKFIPNPDTSTEGNEGMSSVIGKQTGLTLYLYRIAQLNFTNAMSSLVIFTDASPIISVDVLYF